MVIVVFVLARVIGAIVVIVLTHVIVAAETAVIAAVVVHFIGVTSFRIVAITVAVVVIVIVIIRHSVSIQEHKSGIASLTTCKDMHTVDDILRHWQRSCVHSVDDAPC